MLIQLTGKDVERFLALRHRGLVEDHTAFRSAVADDIAQGVDAWRQRLDRDFVVAIEAEGKLVGIGGFARLAGVKLKHKGLVWGMYVAPRARGSGAADQIMTALIDHARTCVVQLQLSLFAGNDRARAFYVRHGFAVYGVEPKAVLDDGVLLDEALMWRAL
ncbi:MAG TPA: GNAT family N-acetyltransferase [Caulobacteraceae bacterium]|jgi:GNAT superfamily N-acetyltransferase|nr:GNAT family N-acetyltransferase [Caulobacteraceae bacterium]